MLMLLRACAMDWGRIRILRVCKNSGPILSRLWTNAHKILGDVGDPLCFPTPLPDCLCPVSSDDIRQWVSKSLKNWTNVKLLWPLICWKGRLQRFYGRLLAQFTVSSLATYGGVPFANFRLRRLAMKYRTQKLRRMSKNSVRILSRL